MRQSNRCVFFFQYFMCFALLAARCCCCCCSLPYAWFVWFVLVLLVFFDGFGLLLVCRSQLCTQDGDVHHHVPARTVAPVTTPMARACTRAQQRWCRS